MCCAVSRSSHDLPQPVLQSKGLSPDLSQGEVHDWQLSPLDQGAGDRTSTECLQRPQMSVALRKTHRHFPVHTPTTKKHIHTSGVSGSRPSFSHLRRKIREKSSERGALTLGPRRGWGNAVTLSTSPSLGWIHTVPWPRTYYSLLKTAHAAPFSGELSSAGSLYSLTPGSDHMLWEFKRLDPCLKEETHLWNSSHSGPSMEAGGG